MPAAAVLLAGAVGCDASSMTGATADTTPSIAVTLTSPQVEAARDQVELLVANVTRRGGYGGDVQLVIDSIPSGVRAQVSGYITENGVTSAFVAVHVDSGVALGIYTMAVRAVAFGLPDIVTPLSVVVEPDGTPGYTLETRPINVTRGTSVTVYANIDRSSDAINVPVTISAEKLPAGVTVSLYPTTNQKVLSNMTVTVGADVEPGQYSLTIRGVTGGLSDRVATIPLQVLPN